MKKVVDPSALRHPLASTSKFAVQTGKLWMRNVSLRLVQEIASIRRHLKCSWFFQVAYRLIPDFEPRQRLGAIHAVPTEIKVMIVINMDDLRNQSNAVSDLYCHPAEADLRITSRNTQWCNGCLLLFNSFVKAAQASVL